MQKINKIFPVAYGTKGQKPKMYVIFQSAAKNGIYDSSLYCMHVNA